MVVSIFLLRMSAALSADEIPQPDRDESGWPLLLESPPVVPSLPGKPRVIIETDVPGGDPDDSGSLVRFFLYLNEFDVEGMLAAEPDGGKFYTDENRNGSDFGKYFPIEESGMTGEKVIHRYIDAYEKVYKNLNLHSPRHPYPAPATLRPLVGGCFKGAMQSDKDLVLQALDRDDPRPLWFLNWGTNDGPPSALKLALDEVKAKRSPEEFQKLMRKIRFVELTDPGNPKREFLKGYYADLVFYIDTFSRKTLPGEKSWFKRWAPLTETAGGFNPDADIRREHGPLCSLYTIQKEGDTGTFMHLIPNGLNAPDCPGWGGWSGRFGFTRFNATETEEVEGWRAIVTDAWNGTTSRDNTLARWVVHIQNNFKARADWCVAERYEDANHEPIPAVNGDRTRHIIQHRAAPGTNRRISAEESTDPDGDLLQYEWFVYPEAGTYDGPVTLSGANQDVCTVSVPEGAASETIHIILQVTDDGAPPLTRYRRIVLTVE